MALVANGVVRFSLNGIYENGTTWTNIWDVWMGGVAEPDRQDRAETYAGLLMEWWESNIAASLLNTVVLQEVSWVDLDTADGSTGSVTTGPNTSPPYQGALTGGGSPANVSLLVTKAGSSARGSRNGRMYLVGFPEEEASAALVDGGYATTLQERLDDFLSQCTDPVEIPEEGINPTIVHTRNTGTPTNPVIEFVGDTHITALVLQSRLATQRRRLRR